MLSHRQREEVIEKLFVLPGHSQKFTEFFKVIDQLYPKAVVLKTLETASHASHNVHPINSTASISEGSALSLQKPLSNQSKSHLSQSPSYLSERT